MRILFYNHTGQIGGAERLLITLLARLDREQFAPLLICPAAGPLHGLAVKEGVPAETIEGLQARFTWRIDHLLRYLISFMQVIRQLRKKVSDSQPDLIHANSVRAGLVATMATVGLKQTVIWHVHDLLPRHPFNIFIRAVAALSSRTQIIAVARASADRLTGKFAGLRRRAAVIPNGVDLEKLSATAGGRERIRHELKIEADAPVIGMIGRLTPAKGQLEVLQLFPAILTRFPNARLLLAGAPAFNNENEYLQLLEQTIAEMNLADRVQLLGARDDVADILQALDLLVVNSASEACSLVILEAMAGGTTVLATSTGGTPEIIEHLRNGWLVAFGNGEELAEGVISLLSDRDGRRRLGAQAQRDSISRYSIPRFMNEMHGYYRAINGVRIPEQKNLPSFEVSLTSD